MDATLCSPSYGIVARPLFAIIKVFRVEDLGPSKRVCQLTSQVRLTDKLAFQLAQQKQITTAAKSGREESNGGREAA